MRGPVRRRKHRRMRIWTRWHGWHATSAFLLIFFIAFSLMVSIDAITNKLSVCRPWVHGARPAGSASKQSRNAMLCGGEVTAENSGFSAFSLMGMALLERLVDGVEKMGMELVKINKKLGMIDTVLHEGAIEEANEIVNEGLDNGTG